MKFRRAHRFKKEYQKLPSDIQQRVDQKLRLLLRKKKTCPRSADYDLTCLTAIQQAIAGALTL